MGYPKRTATLCFLSFVFLGCNRTAHASFDEPIPGQDRRGCGDYTILSDARDRALFDRHCGTNNEKDFQILRDAVKKLNPKREARAAALRGDFRFAAVTVGGPPPVGMTRLWATEGVDCKNLKDSDMVIFVRYPDVILGPTFLAFQSNMVDFAIQYNKKLINQNSFPAERECAPLKYKHLGE